VCKGRVNASKFCTCNGVGFTGAVGVYCVQLFGHGIIERSTSESAVRRVRASRTISVKGWCVYPFQWVGGYICGEERIRVGR
jgi:hypothetical protein